jgi:SpoVK/Ycf46/Vps4 family AAA+-type ATPase
MSGFVFLLSEESCRQLDPSGRIDLELEIAALKDEQRMEAWQMLAAAYEVDASLDWPILASRFRFNPGQIVNALRTARNLSEWHRSDEQPGPIRWNEMIEACYKQLNHRLGTKSKRLSPKSGWEDLVLPGAQIQKLRHACNHIQYKHTVYGSWGFERKLSYGTGVSLLFAGPPGTGKTMAAEIVANELDMEIYKIDLSQIISKYIGETEKNLREIFDEAESSYAILFFDEADALFGKRSEVKDSHDKNANTEVAFLLQKMEEYRGISILATNYLQNIDEAFLRRINYVIRFSFPDEEQRKEIWQGIFPKQTPLEPELDYDFLARKLPMAGGSIKNIALTSAFLASGDSGAVGMKHILKAYQYELDKTNRTISRDELGEYAFYFEDIHRI